MYLDDIPVLEDWMTFPAAAALLGVSLPGFHKMVFEQAVFKYHHLRKVGDRPLLLVRRDMVLREKARRDAAAQAQPEKKSG